MFIKFNLRNWGCVDVWEESLTIILPARGYQNLFAATYIFYSFLIIKKN